MDAKALQQQLDSDGPHIAEGDAAVDVVRVVTCAHGLQREVSKSAIRSGIDRFQITHLEVMYAADVGRHINK